MPKTWLGVKRFSWFLFLKSTGDGQTVFTGDCQFSVTPWGQECMCGVVLMAMDVPVRVGCHLCLFFRAMWGENHRPGQT